MQSDGPIVGIIQCGNTILSVWAYPKTTTNSIDCWSRQSAIQASCIKLEPFAYCTQQLLSLNHHQLEHFNHVSCVLYARIRWIGWASDYWRLQHSTPLQQFDLGRRNTAKQTLFCFNPDSSNSFARLQIEREPSSELIRYHHLNHRIAVSKTRSWLC